MESEAGWVHIDDPAIARLIEFLKSRDGVFLVVVHKKRVVKLQVVQRENLLDIAQEQNLAGCPKVL